MRGAAFERKASAHDSSGIADLRAVGRRDAAGGRGLCGAARLAGARLGGATRPAGVGCAARHGRPAWVARHGRPAGLPSETAQTRPPPGSSVTLSRLRRSFLDQTATGNRIARFCWARIADRYRPRRPGVAERNPQARRSPLRELTIIPTEARRQPRRRWQLGGGGNSGSLGGQSAHQPTSGALSPHESGESTSAPTTEGGTSSAKGDGGSLQERSVACWRFRRSQAAEPARPGRVEAARPRRRRTELALALTRMTGCR
jgi:hypothetical protein